MDTDLLTEEDLYQCVAAREANGFFGPVSWYMNHQDNREYAATARNGARC
jgi:hypothetical protein